MATALRAMTGRGGVIQVEGPLASFRRWDGAEFAVPESGVLRAWASIPPDEVSRGILASTECAPAKRRPSALSNMPLLRGPARGVEGARAWLVEFSDVKAGLGFILPGRRLPNVDAAQYDLLAHVEDVREIRGARARRKVGLPEGGMALKLRHREIDGDLVRSLHALRLVRRGTYADGQLVPWRRSALGDAVLALAHSRGARARERLAK